MRVLRKNNIPQRLLVSFYRSTIESILGYCLCVWYTSCTVAQRTSLQRIINMAQKITGCPLLTLEELHHYRCLRKARKITQDPSHPGHHMLSLLPSEDNNAEILLLVWRYREGSPRDCSRSFQISGCTVTGDRSMYHKADAVIMRHRDVITDEEAPLPPEPRPPAQKWIWSNVESPTNVPRLWEYEGIYNLTMTYREDSDIFVPLGYLIPNALLHKVPRAPFAYPLSSSWNPRPGFVAWVVSHWGDLLERVHFYKLLKDYIKIDLFGRAGTTTLPPGKDSVVQMIRRYRFYLAFENAQHTDYITEKLWNTVRGGAIPVVLGPSRKNYERFLPPQAFIHVDDFPTVQELALYLLKVKDSPALIQMHLSWRRDYSVYTPSLWGEFYCTACKAVRMRKGRINVIKNLTAWFLS
ncbi:alpha-(1,3)-fucosyltransferase 4-like [Salarias fasciatus]|uniref:alpha-(1,3)-fucosyltransferase 4-like n=1 Tax=Salarias fasciatus TaxID=181472 RepID=UPI001176F71E|nr:alpha-(1,3)-fucosyltransferase 4-like [Salarias fasciatus]